MDSKNRKMKNKWLIDKRRKFAINRTKSAGGVEHFAVKTDKAIEIDSLVSFYKEELYLGTGLVVDYQDEYYIITGTYRKEYLEPGLDIEITTRIKGIKTI